MISGLVVVDKPAGMTSHDVVSRCRRIFGQRRVGHSGTLDPDATGVLVVGLGHATRLLTWLTGLPKTYECEIVLGVATSTLDAAGEVTGTWDMRAVGDEDVEAAAARLTGEIEQIPPMVSAIKIGGRRLHQLAREGIEVDRPARKVRVDHFAVWRLPGDQGADGPVYRASVACSSGTYVRSLAADLGTDLGGGAHLRALQRTSVGPWTRGEATPLDEVGPHSVAPPAVITRVMEGVRVGDEVGTAVGHGKVLARATLGVDGAGPWAVVDEAGGLLAVYVDHGEGQVKPAVVIP